jgi:hypothetical protein
MVWVGAGTPESDGNARRKNTKMAAIKDQAKAHIRDFYKELSRTEKADLRAFLKSYVKLRSNRTYLMRQGALQQQLDKGIGRHKANADVLATTKSFATVDQILEVVNAIDPLVKRPFRKRL